MLQQFSYRKLPWFTKTPPARAGNQSRADSPRARALTLELMFGSRGNKGALTYSKLTPDLLLALQQQHCTPLAPDGRMLSIRLSALAGSWCNCLHLSALLSAHWSSWVEAIASIYRWGTLHCRFSATFSKACQKHEGLHFTRHSGELAKLLWKIFCKVTFSNSSNWLSQFPDLRPDHVPLLTFRRYQRFLSTIPPAQVSEKGPGQ